MSPPKRKFTASELIPGQLYQVKYPFRDYDRVLHPAGEQWRFVQKSFLPYEDGLTLFIEQEGQNLSIRLQWREESQGIIIDNFSRYVEEV
jgi:hypothetical protein